MDHNPNLLHIYVFQVVFCIYLYQILLVNFMVFFINFKLNISSVFNKPGDLYQVEFENYNHYIS